MGWNGSGVFSKTYSWVADAANGIKILASRHDTNDTDFVSGINNCITKDGQNSATADLPMGGNNHTNVGVATALTEYSRASQVIDSTLTWLGTSSGTDTITATLSITPSAYAAGQRFAFLAGGTNTGAATLNIDSLGAKAIQKNGQALVAGDITANDIVYVVYDGTQFQMISPARTPVLTSGSIATAAIANDAITNDKVADNAIDETSLKDALIPDFTEAVVTASDSFLFSDADDSGNSKRDTIQGVLDLVESITLGTPVATTSGTAIDFTSIPSGTKRISINFTGVSTSGTDNWLVQIGDSGGVEGSGYSSRSANVIGSNNAVSSTAGFIVATFIDGTETARGRVVLELANATSFTWVSTHTLEGSNDDVEVGGGSKSLSAELDRVRITTTGGSNTFDAGEINIQYSK